MFVTHGNRRPKPALKLTCEKTPSVRNDIQHLLDEGTMVCGRFQFYLHRLPGEVVDTITGFRDEHKNKQLIAFLGNEIKGKSGSREVEVSLYALPKRSVQKVEDRYRKNPVVHLRSDFVFDDKDVGATPMVTLLVDACQEYHAYESDEEAKAIMATAPAATERLGRFPCVMQDGKLHVALPLAGHHTRQDYIARQQAALTPRITLKTANSRSKGRISVQDGTHSPKPPLKVSMTADVDIKALPDGRYRAIRDGVYQWLIKSSLKAGTINLETLLLLAHDDPNADDVPLKDLPESAKASA